MRYNWDYKELVSNQNKLEQLIRTKQYDEDLINQLLSVYQNMIKILNNKDNYNDITDDTLRISVEEMIHSFNEFYSSKTIPVLNLILPATEIITEYNVKNNKLLLLHNNTEKLIAVVMDFFEKMTTPKMCALAEEVLDPKNHILNIGYSKKDANYPGVTIFDIILNKKYIHINRSNNVFDFSSLVHEIFHYIYSTTTPEDNLSGLYICETDGMLANILWSDYINKYASLDEDRDYFKIDFLRAFKQQVEETMVRNAILFAINDREKLRLNKLNKLLCPYNIENFKTLDSLIPYLEIPQDTNVTYALSYLVALDLFYIYQKDKEFSFCLLNSLMQNKDEDIKSLLGRHNITFFEDDYKNLKRYIKNTTN